MQFLNVMIAHTIDCFALFVKITNESKLKAGDTKDRLKHAGLVTAQFFKTMGGDDQGVGDHLARLGGGGLVGRSAIHCTGWSVLDLDQANDRIGPLQPVDGR